MNTIEIVSTAEAVRYILEEIDSIPFVAGETGLGMDEQQAWKDRLEHDLRKLVGARRTCILCGEKVEGDHNCYWNSHR